MKFKERLEITGDLIWITNNVPQRRGGFNGARHVGSGAESSTKYKLQTGYSSMTTPPAPCGTQLVTDPRAGPVDIPHTRAVEASTGRERSAAL
jgi:hypothetical protein